MERLHFQKKSARNPLGFARLRLGNALAPAEITRDHVSKCFEDRTGVLTCRKDSVPQHDQSRQRPADAGNGGAQTPTLPHGQTALSTGGRNERSAAYCRAKSR